MPRILCTLHFSVSQRTDLWFVTDKYLCKRRVWDISHARIVYKMQVTSTIQESSAPIFLPMDRSVVCDWWTFEEGQGVGLLIIEFVGIHNVVTNLMRATNFPRLFCLFCGSRFLNHCLGLIFLWMPESLVRKVRKWLYAVVRVCARSFVCMYARCF